MTCQVAIVILKTVYQKLQTFTYHSLRCHQCSIFSLYGETNTIFGMLGALFGNWSYEAVMITKSWDNSINNASSNK